MTVVAAVSVELKMRAGPSSTNSVSVRAVMYECVYVACKSVDRFSRRNSNRTASSQTRSVQRNRYTIDETL